MSVIIHKGAQGFGLEVKFIFTIMIFAFKMMILVFKMIFFVYSK